MNKFLPSTKAVALKMPSFASPEVVFDLPGRGGVFNMPNLNLYAYTQLNPVRLTDPDGRWSTEGHNYFIDQAFPNTPAKIRNAMKEGSRSADAWYNQLSGGDHIHSMWPKGGNAQTMAKLRSDYIKGRLGEFSRLMGDAQAMRAKGLYGAGMAEKVELQAWKAYGEALHPIMDSTSPVHNEEWSMMRDYKKHGDFDHSQETVKDAPAHRDETVRRMYNIKEFIQKDKSDE